MINPMCSTPVNTPGTDGGPGVDGDARASVLTVRETAPAGDTTRAQGEHGSLDTKRCRLHRRHRGGDEPLAAESRTPRSCSPQEDGEPARPRSIVFAPARTTAEHFDTRGF